MVFVGCVDLFPKHRESVLPILFLLERGNILRKWILVFLIILVFSIPVFAYSYPSLPPEADNYENYFIAYSKQDDTYVCMIYNGQLDSTISYGSYGSRTHTLNTTDGYYYKYSNNNEWVKEFSNSAPHVVVYYHGNDGVVVEKLTGLIISNVDDLTERAIDTLNFLGYEVGESLPRLIQVGIWEKILPTVKAILILVLGSLILVPCLMILVRKFLSSLRSLCSRL